jgi:ATP-dependent RNA helicase DHX29
MEGDAVRDETQALNYVATLALFSIATTQVHRQLPPVFRELWDELDAQKREADSRAYRERLRLFKSLAETRVQAAGVEEQKQIKRAPPLAETEDQPVYFRAPAEPAEHYRHEILARQALPSYQEMLVCFHYLQSDI